MTKKNKRILNEVCEHCGHELRCGNCRLLPKSNREVELLELLKGAVDEWSQWVFEDDMAWRIGEKSTKELKKKHRERIAAIRKKISLLK